MVRRIGAVGASLALAASCIGLAGCGSGAPSHHGSGSAAHAAAAASTTGGESHVTTLPSGQTLVEAADRSARAPGYRLAATAALTDGSTHVAMRMQGVIERHGTVAGLTAEETIAGRRLTLQVRTANGMYYMSGIPGLSQVTHGRHWLSFDLEQAEAAQGVGGLQSAASANPAQFLSYLRAVGSGVTRVGTATIDGDATTEYRAELDLDRYAALVAPAKRAAARRAVARLEDEIGAHQLPVTVWIDGRHEVRRMHLRFPVCAAGQRLSMSMTMDLSDYGVVAPVAIPAASDTDDVTSRLASQLRAQHAPSGGCPTAATG